MTPTEYVVLAKKMGKAIREIYPEPTGHRVFVRAEGDFGILVRASDRLPSFAVLWTVDDENTASEAALVRALLASAIMVEACCCCRHAFEAHIDDEAHHGETEDEAREALLDALLDDKNLSVTHTKTQETSC